MLLSRPTQGLALAACVATASCSSHVSTTPIADELVALPASDLNCAVGAASADEASPDFARKIMVRTRSTPAAVRFVFVKVDSLNRPREFVAGVSEEVDHAAKMQSTFVSFDVSGHVTDSRRRLTTKDATGRVDSSSVALSGSDTSRVRILTSEVTDRCTH